MNTNRARPTWVDEEPLIQSVLGRFLDQVERSVKPSYRITKKSTPELYDYQDDDPKYLWDLFKSLDNEYHVLTIKKQRAKSGHESFENAQLFFNLDKEPLIRSWLNRPAFDPYTLTWNDSFAKVCDVFEDGGEALLTPLRVEGKTANEVLQSFAKLANEITTSQTLRNLSAKCFWGDSKFLDSKLKLVQALFPRASHTILPRPIMMNISLPEQIEDIIFIENQDSFLMLKQLAEKDPRFLKTAFVYSSGFKGTSSTIRKRGQVVFSCLSNPNSTAFSDFENWWFDSDTESSNIKSYFWGDMDYAGMGILSSLRKSFRHVVCWPMGFNRMLDFHQHGHGHQIRDSKKMQQLDPGTTGCSLADNIILPEIRRSQRFLDQEIIASGDMSS